MIILLILSQLFGGGGAATILTYVQGHTPKEIRKVVKQEVADESRRDAALAAVDAWGKADKQQDKTLAKAHKGLLKLVTQDGARLADTAEFTAQIDAAITESDRNFLDMRFALKGQLTQAEWDAAIAHLNK